MVLQKIYSRPKKNLYNMFLGGICCYFLVFDLKIDFQLHFYLLFLFFCPRSSRAYFLDQKVGIKWGWSWGGTYLDFGYLLAGISLYYCFYHTYIFGYHGVVHVHTHREN